MSRADEMIDAMIDPMYESQPVEYWRTKNGTIAIKDMTNTHLINTINFLRRQIDGSVHDDFVWDNITAMEYELRKRGISNGRKN